MIFRFTKLNPSFSLFSVKHFTLNKEKEGFLMSVKITKDQYSTQYDNITSGVFYLYGDLGGYIYKSYESMRRDFAKFKDHIKPVSECNTGAHYYVQAPYTTNYNSASATVDFNSVSVTPKDRNAYISLGLVTDGSSKFFSFDIGLTYDKTKGWVSYAIAHGGTAPEPEVNCSDSSVTKIWQFYKNNYSGARYCDIRIDVSKTSSNDIVKVTYTYRSASVTLATCILTYRFKAGELFDADYSNPKLRFMRFISLVPQNEDGTHDDADSSVLNANLTNLKLGTSNWTDSQIDYAWSVQGANISELKISTLSGTTANSDSIKINHRYQLH